LLIHTTMRDFSGDLEEDMVLDLALGAIPVGAGHCYVDTWGRLLDTYQMKNKKTKTFIKERPSFQFLVRRLTRRVL
jgi:hypothetical protein